MQRYHEITHEYSGEGADELLRLELEPCTDDDCNFEHVYYLTDTEFDAIWQHVPEYYRTNFGNSPD